MTLLFLTLAFLALVLAAMWLRSRRFWKCVMAFDGDKGWPLLGEAMDFPVSLKDYLKVLEGKWKRNGMTNFRLLVGPFPFIFLLEPESYEIYLSSTKELKKLPDYEFLHAWLGKGLLVSDGAKWKSRRRIITPSFHFTILEQFLPMFDDKGNTFISKLAQQAGKGPVEIYNYITLYTLDVICETAMGTNMKLQEDANTAYVRAVSEINDIIHHRSFSILERIPFTYKMTGAYRAERRALKVLHELPNRVIAARRAVLKDEEGHQGMEQRHDDVYGGKRKMAFLDMLLLAKTADGGSLSDEDVREEVNTFMFEGHDTTASCISFVLYSIAENPDVQARILEEQRRIFAENPDRAATYADLQAMNYLDRVVRETLRLYPSVPIFGRTTMNDVTLPDGKTIPAGCNVLFSPYFMARNPKHFPDPMKFDPDRYLPENTKNMHPYLNLAFSAGPRNCIGQKFVMLEIKSVLGKVVRRFELTTAGPEHSPRLMATLTLKSSNGINIVINERKSI